LVFFLTASPNKDRIAIIIEANLTPSTMFLTSKLVDSTNVHFRV
jgi:hypothetical protein